MAPDFKDYAPRYNAAPSQFVPAILADDSGKRVLTNLLWMLTPPWAEKEGSKYSGQINIRNDTIEKNRYFRSLLMNQRCIFVADGFYEWQTPPGYKKGMRKIPYRIVMKNDDIIPLAGLYRTTEEKKKFIHTGAIITTNPNKLMMSIHNRMPVILSGKSLDHWLDPAFKNFDQLRQYLSPFPESKMKAYEVSTAVNNARLDIPALIKNVD